MAIICYAGQPGQGKSYSVVENVILPALKSGRVVAHNLILNLDVLSVLAERDVAAQLVAIDKACEPEEWLKRCPPGAVIVIDEAWRYWPSGTKANEVPRDQLAFFKEHRHRVGADDKATEIVLIDQDPQTALPAWLRPLITFTYIYVKHSSLGLTKRYRCDVYNQCQSIEKPKKAALLRKLQGRYDPRIFAAYISHTQSEKVGEGAMEVQADSRANLWRAVLPGVVVALVVIVVAIIGLSRTANRMAGAGKPPQTAPKPSFKPYPVQPAPAPAPAPVVPVAAPAPAPVAPPAPPPAPKFEGPQLSQKWRLIGVAIRKDGSGVAMVASSIARRRVNADLCKLSRAPADYECLIDGERVTQWSGAVAYASAQLPEGALPVSSP